MKLLVLGYHTHPPRLKEHEVNAKTWSSISPYFSAIDIVVQSTEPRLHFDTMDNVRLVTSPRTGWKLIDVLLYSILAFLWGIRCLAYGYRTVECSELVVAGPVAYLLSKIGSTDLLSDVQGEILTMTANAYPLEGVIRAVSRWICLRSSRVRVVSKKLMHDVLRIGVDSNKVFLARNRVDTGLFYPASDDYGLIENVDNLQILCIGSLIPVKGFQYAIKALNIIRKEYPNAGLHIAGIGSECNNLKQIVNTLNLDNHVFFHGFVQHSSLPDLFKKADIFLLSSLSEGLPRVVLEAMASGVPVVSTKVGGVVEVIVDGVTGILVAPKSSDAIVNGIKRLLSDSTIGRMFAKNALGMIRKEFAWKMSIEKQVQFMIGT